MPHPSANEHGFSVQGLGVRRGDRWLLREIDWSVPGSRCVGLLGPNGSGKSTLARVLMGQLWATQGRVCVLGRTFGKADLHELRREMRLVQPSSIVPPDPQMLVSEWVLTGFFGTTGLFDATTEAQQATAVQTLSRVGMSALKDSPIGRLSDGERVRCLLARALVTRPRLLLLDEPTAGLDLFAREQVLAAVQRLASDPAGAPTVVMITHHIEELPPATADVLLLSGGRAAAQGPPQEVLTDKNLSAAYGCAVQIHRQGGRYFTHVAAGAWDNLLSD